MVAKDVYKVVLILGQIRVTRDTTEVLPCSTVLPADRDDWQRLYCVGVDPNTHNHRVIVDGPGSETVYNGHEFKTDLLYTRANQYISGEATQKINSQQSLISGVSCLQLRHFQNFFWKSTKKTSCKTI